MFQRRHYRAIATMLSRYRLIMVSSQWQLMVDGFIQMFAIDNPRFDRERFLMWATEK